MYLRSHSLAKHSASLDSWVLTLGDTLMEPGSWEMSSLENSTQSLTLATPELVWLNLSKVPKLYSKIYHNMSNSVLINILLLCIFDIVLCQECRPLIPYPCYNCVYTIYMAGHSLILGEWQGKLLVNLEWITGSGYRSTGHWAWLLLTILSLSILSRWQSLESP